MKKFLLLLFTLSLLFACNEESDEPTIPNELEKIKISNSEITLHRNETFNLSVAYHPITIEPEPSFTWETEDSTVATVNAETGFVEAVRVGKTNIIVSTEQGHFTDMCKVNVEPTSTLFREPYLNFSASAAEIKAYESRVLISENSKSLIFQGDNSNIIYVVYLFDNGRIDASFVEVKGNAIDELLIYIDERYSFIGREGDFNFYSVNNDSYMALSVTDDATLLLMYLELEVSSLKSASNSTLIDRFNKAFENYTNK